MNNNKTREGAARCRAALSFMKRRKPAQKHLEVIHFGMLPAAAFAAEDTLFGPTGNFELDIATSWNGT